MFNFIQNIDILVVEKIYRFQHNLNSELFNRIMIFFTNLGDHGTVWIAIALILLLNKKYRKTGILAVVSLAICSLVVNIILKPNYIKATFKFNCKKICPGLLSTTLNLTRPQIRTENQNLSLESTLKRRSCFLIALKFRLIAPGSDFC